MRTTLFAVVSLVIGASVGWLATRSEFSVPAVELTDVAARGTSAGVDSAKKIGPLAKVVNGQRYDFGTMDRFTTQNHTFIITNNGDEPLILKLGKTTCKCTLGELAKGELQPGERTEVKLEWTARTTGEQFEQSAEINTNDKNNNPLQLTVHGHVSDVMRVDPEQFTLNNISASDPFTAKLRLLARKEPKLTVLSHSWAKPETAQFFDVSFEPIPQEDLGDDKIASGVTIVLQTKPGLPLGQLSQTLKVTTNIDPEEPLEIPLLGSVASDISIVGPGVKPEHIFVDLKTVERGAGTKQTVYVIVKGELRDETTVKIASVTPTEQFSAVLGEADRSNPKLVRYPLTIEVPPDALPIVRAARDTYARIKLEIDHPVVKEMEIRVRYVVK
jgi:hypothetical protein